MHRSRPSTAETIGFLVQETFIVKVHNLDRIVRKGRDCRDYGGWIVAVLAEF